MRSLFSFPDPVNETSARLVAAGVVALTTAFLVSGNAWLLAALVYGFAARVATGPTLSPLGQFVTRLATPFLERRGVVSRQVPGPPKRFAQAVGLTFAGSAAVAWLVGPGWLAVALLVGLIGAATLEAAFGICLGCIAYSAIWGCADCTDISERLQQAVVRARADVDSIAA